MRKKGNNNKDKRPSTRSRNGGKAVSSKDRDYEDIPVRGRNARECDNDWQWYAQTPELVKAYASYPFGFPLGTTVPFSGAASTNNVSIPGLMGIYFSPSVGVSTEENAPVNIAMRNIYTYVRHANSGHSNYDAPDLFMYLLAMDSVYMLYAYMKRIYQIMPLTSPFNRYYAKGIVEAMGMDFDDLQAHYADFNGFINLYMTKISKLCVPASMSYMARHTWMCENLFMDSNTEKAQTYFYCPNVFFKLTLSAEGATSLTGTEFFNPRFLGGAIAKKKLEELIAFANDLVNPILANEDMNIMSGDILKAYGDGGIVRLSGVQIGSMVLPVYNQEVLSQMENSIAVGDLFSAENKVEQNVAVGGGYLVYAPTATQWVDISNITGALPSNPTEPVLRQLFPSYIGPRVLNFHHSGVTPEEVMVATRLMTRCSIGTAKATWQQAEGQTQLVLKLPIASCGSEIVTYYAIGTYINNVSKYGYRTFTSTLYWANNREATDVAFKLPAFLTSLLQTSVFDWNPMLNAVVIDRSTLQTTYQAIDGLFADVDYYTVLDDINVGMMHSTALLSEFSI